MTTAHSSMMAAHCGSILALISMIRAESNENPTRVELLRAPARYRTSPIKSSPPQLIGPFAIDLDQRTFELFTAATKTGDPATSLFRPNGLRVLANCCSGSVTILMVDRIE